jgi:hypothetical protein
MTSRTVRPLPGARESESRRAEIRITIGIHPAASRTLMILGHHAMIVTAFVIIGSSAARGLRGSRRAPCEPSALLLAQLVRNLPNRGCGVRGRM